MLRARTSSVRLPVVREGAGVLFLHQASIHAVHGHVGYIPAVAWQPSVQLCSGKKGMFAYLS